METLQIVLLTLSSIITLFFFVITLNITNSIYKLKKKIIKEDPAFLQKLKNKLTKLLSGKEDFYDDFSKDEMACSILIITMDAAKLRMTLFTTIASIITVYIYYM